MKNIFFVALLAVSCSKTPNTTKEETTPTDSVKVATADTSANALKSDNSQKTELTTSVYRCDGCHNGLPSEWVKLYWSADHSKIEKMEYWSTANEKPAELKIVKQEHSDGEIAAISGKVLLPGTKDAVSFVILEDKVTLDGSEFSYEVEK